MMIPLLFIILWFLSMGGGVFIPTPPTIQNHENQASKGRGCEYLGKFYEPGLIRKDVSGKCVSEVTCEEGGAVSVGDSAGCFGYDDIHISTPLPDIRKETAPFAITFPPQWLKKLFSRQR